MKSPASVRESGSVPAVSVTRAGRPGAPFGCLGSIVAAVLVLAAVALIAAVGLVVLAVIAAGVLVTGLALLTRRGWRAVRGHPAETSWRRGGVIDVTATEEHPDPPTLPGDRPRPPR